MPKNAPASRQCDYALLEKRYLKLLKIAALPDDQKDEAIRALLHKFDRENGQKETPQPAFRKKPAP